MAEIMVIKGLNQELRAGDQESARHIAKWKPNDPLLIKARRPRNGPFFRKWWSLINLLYENQDLYEDFDQFRKEMTMRAGWYEKHVHLSGQVSYVAKSIAWHKMSEDEFVDLYNKTIDAALEYLLPTTGRQDLENEVLVYMGNWSA